MCTFDNNPRLKKPKKDKIVVYKVFRENTYASKGVIGDPTPATSGVLFKFGWNKWDAEGKGSDNDQLGFQVFAKRADARNYAFGWEFVCPVVIYTKNIIKITNSFFNRYRIYEVKSFAIWKKDWEEKEKGLK